MSLTWPHDLGVDTEISNVVLYPRVGNPVAWAGVVNYNEKPSVELAPLYHDGRVYDLNVDISPFAASLEVFSYPDVLDDDDYDYGLSYVTKQGDKRYLHLVYNARIVAQPWMVRTRKDQPDLTLFSWDIYTRDVAVDGFRPTAHFIVDPSEMSALRMQHLEYMLYGSFAQDPHFPPLSEIMGYLNRGEVLTVFVTSQGVATIDGPAEVVRPTGDPTLWTIEYHTVTPVDPVTYQIQSE